MAIARTDMPTTTHAAGAITPLLRAAAHIGYALGGLGSTTTEVWEAQRPQINADIRAELTEAINHMTVSPLVNDNPYASEQARNALQRVIAQLSDAQNADYEDLSDLFETVANLGHNLAYCGQIIDRDTFGLRDASAGIST